MNIAQTRQSSLALVGIAAAGARVGGQPVIHQSPPQPLPEDAADAAAPLAIESWSTGSATLVPLMAADMQATPTTPASTRRQHAPARPVGKPIDDITFVKQATESGRKEVSRRARRAAAAQESGIETHRRNAGAGPQQRECEAVEDRRGQGLAGAGAAAGGTARPRAPRAATSTANGPRK